VRSRFRESSHALAHGEEDDSLARGQVPDHPLIAPGRANLITRDDELAPLIDELRRPRPECGGQRVFAFDSEFIGESTYRPRLCLIQVATPGQITFIDPLSDIDLSPFWRLFGDADVRKIVHAGEQDLEPVVRAGIEPAGVVDTQVIAGFAALPYPTSLARLVEHAVGVRLGKGLTFTQWDQRPLSKKQLAYAADDVRFLLALSAVLLEKLESAAVLAWALEECARRSRLVARNDLQEPWERVRGIGHLSGQQLAIMRELAVWRDDVARSADLPPRALIRDEVLLDLVKHPPPDLSRLGQIRHMPRPVAEQYGPVILDAIKRGREAQPLKLAARGAEPTLTEKFASDAAMSLLQTIAVGRGIDPALLANRRDVESFARLAGRRQSLETHPLMQGWRREAAGELMHRLITTGGGAQLEWVEGRPVLKEA
jgi:ribonuclease D